MNDELTIVGPEPGQSRAAKRGKSKNFEALMLMAKYDHAFRAALFRDRQATLRSAGLRLSPGEQLVLGHVTDEQLAQTIREFTIPGVTKKTLSTWAKAASVLALLTSLTMAQLACGSDSDTGTDPSPLVDGITPDSTSVHSTGIMPG
jgi:hypothetical protein